MEPSPPVLVVLPSLTRLSSSHSPAGSFTEPAIYRAQTCCYRAGSAPATRCFVPQLLYPVMCPLRPDLHPRGVDPLSASQTNPLRASLVPHTVECPLLVSSVRGLPRNVSRCVSGVVKVQFFRH